MKNASNNKQGDNNKSVMDLVPENLFDSNALRLLALVAGAATARMFGLFSESVEVNLGFGALTALTQTFLSFAAGKDLESSPLGEVLPVSTILEKYIQPSIIAGIIGFAIPAIGATISVDHIIVGVRHLQNATRNEIW